MKYLIRCTLPNASENINGIPFHQDGDAMVCETEDHAVAENFAQIPGYEVAEAGKPKADAPVKSIGEMTLAEIKELLDEHPSAVDDVELAEMERETPRKGVLEAIADVRDAQAKTTQEQ